MPDLTDLWVPSPTRNREQPLARPEGRPVIWNDTDYPDELAVKATEVFFEEHASVLGVNPQASFGGGAFEGSLLARAKWKVPTNVIEEMMLSRYLAERDDDVGSVIGAMIAIAFGDGYQHIHDDELTITLFDEIAGYCNLDRVLADIYRELLICAQVTTVCPFVRDSFQFSPPSADRQRTRSLVAPLVGVIPSEQIRVFDNDMFGTGTLAYKPATGVQEAWLQEYFDKTTTPARKAEMQRQDPVLTSLLIRQVEINPNDPSMFAYEPYALDPATGNFLYVMNPDMSSRSSFPKGAWKYPRPLMTRDLALLEAKRLLSVMDFALLQGTANYLVVVKKGTDQRPALPEEIANLRHNMRLAARSGVIVGDHRLNVEVITPEMSEMLNSTKRQMLGQKIAAAMLRLPDFTKGEGTGGQATITDTEILARVVSSDRLIIKRHVERYVYKESAVRNPQSFPTGPAKLWFPKIVLAGLQQFTDMLIKLRDRGDIPRKYAVEAAGFDYQAAVAQRKREKANGDDKVLTPPPVPFTKPGQQPNLPGSGDPYNFPTPDGDGGGSGRPKGTPGNGTPASKKKVSPKGGETVAIFDDETGLVRVGENTYGILESYEDTKRFGRLTAQERAVLAAREAGNLELQSEGPLIVIPVNGEYEIEDIKAVRLDRGVSVLVGNRVEDGAVVAAALSFREPEYKGLDANETAMRWGFSPMLRQLDAPTT